jgi:FkbM family methyltransferase
MTAGLQDTQHRFRDGALTKHQYIEAMYALHARLFEYPEMLRGGAIERIEVDADGVVFASRWGVRFRLDPLDRRQAPLEALNFRSFEDDDEAMLASLLEPGWAVFDVGANVGWYTLHLACRQPTARLYAFEPVPSTFGRLETNLTMNGPTNVRLFNFGLGAREEELTFYVYPEGSGGASAANNSGRPSVREVRCRVRPLDAVAAELGVGPDLMKVDVEGAELFVFQGGWATLKHSQPLIFCEMLRKWAAHFGYHPNAIIDLLASAGYGCFDVKGGALTPVPRVEETTVATNFFFLHRDRHAELLRTRTAR